MSGLEAIVYKAERAISFSDRTKSLDSILSNEKSVLSEFSGEDSRAALVTNGFTAGEFFLPNAESYSGSLLGSKPEGLGKYAWSDGSEYEGEWRHGMGQGYGKFRWPSGYTVGKITPIPSREVRATDFGSQASFWMKFPRKGSQLTPPHQSDDFKWKDYCPMIFRSFANVDLQPPESMEDEISPQSLVLVLRGAGDKDVIRGNRLRASSASGNEQGIE